MARTTASPSQQEILQAIAQFASPQGWQKARIPLLDGGMRTDRAGHDLAPNESPLINNLTLVANRLVVDTGYVALGSPYGGTFLGTVQLFYQVFNPDGTAISLLITTAAVYSLNTTLNQWQLVGNTSFYSNVGVVSSGATSMTLTSAAGLSTGQTLGLPLDDGEQLPVTITGIAGAVVSFTPAIPSPRTVPASSNIVLAYALKGSLQLQVSAIAFPAKSWVIFSNAIDPLFYFDGTFIKNLVTGSDLPANTTATWLAVFHESLLLLGPEENGQEFPQRVRMSDIGNPQSFKPASAGGPATSIAAIYDLLDTEDFIKCGFVLGPYFILYRETTIMRGTYYGVLNNIIFWEYMIGGEGVRSQGAVAELGSSHQIVGNGDVYDYQGDYSLISSGDAIFISLLSAVGDLNPTTQNTLFSQYQQDYDENWVIYPSGASLLPNKMLRHSLEKDGWFIRQFANEFVSASPYLPLSATTWATAVGTWAQQTAQWNSRIFLANVASVVLCAPDTNTVYVYDFKQTTDAGKTIAWTVQTKDIGEGDSKQRWDNVRVFGIGKVDNLQFSLDEGNTWTSAGALSLGTTPALGILTFQAVSQYIRFQLTGTDSTFTLFWLEVWYQEESEY